MDQCFMYDGIVLIFMRGDLFQFWDRQFVLEHW